MNQHTLNQHIKRGIMILVSLCTIFSLACPQPVGAAPAAQPVAQVSGCTTSISADIAANATWGTGGSPYCLTTDITVKYGATLTISPGVTVRGLLQSSLTVQGALNATGTAAAPITFTSALNSGAGQWVGLVFDGYYGGGKGTLAYAAIRFAGANTWNQYHAVGVQAGAQVTIDHVQVLDSLGNGVEMRDDASQLTFTNNTVQNSGGYPLVVSADAAGLASGNVFSSNHPDRVLVSAGVAITVKTSATWRAGNGSGVYELRSETAVASGATLTLEPGVTLMSAAGVALLVNGGLVANGTASQPITFTSAINTGPAQWTGLKFSGYAGSGSGTGSISYAIIRYTGLAYYGDNSAISLAEGANVTIDHVQIRDCFGYGARVMDSASQLTFTQNTVSGCTSAPLWIMPQNLAGVSGSVFTNNGTDQIRTGDDPLAMEFDARISATNQVDAFEFGGDMRVGSQGHLMVDPGVTVLVRPGSTVEIVGNLETLGTASQRVLFSSAAAAPKAGDWVGLRFEGLAERHAQGALNYTTVEYAGADSWGKQANIYTNNADVRIDHGLIRYSLLDGVYANEGSEATRIAYSEIINNPGYGVFHAVETAGFVAVNNWWGSATGPKTIGNCNPAGTGSLVSDNVVFSPFIAAQGVDPDPLAPPFMAFASIRPTRWYVPADGSSQAWVEITVRDGAGNPLPQRSIHLTTTRGSFQSADVITNAEGKAFTYLISSDVGTATVTARPGVSEVTCSANFQTASTQLTFTGTGASELSEDESAPYMNQDLEIAPEPVTQGVPTKVRIHLSNPYTQPISVDGTMGYAQYGIGMAFGPIQEVTGWVIPAGQEAVYEIDWTPPISGHFCLEFTFWYDGTQTPLSGSASVSSDGTQGSGKKKGHLQNNTDSKPAPLMPKKPKDITQKAQKAMDMIGDGQFTITAIKDTAGIPGGFIQDQMLGNIFDFNFDLYGAASCAMMGGENCGGWKGPRLKLPGGGYGSLFKDPPSQDYTEIAPADPIPFTPLQASGSMPAARASAINALMTAALKFTVNLMAAVVSGDRYGGAAAAGDLEWSSQQASAFVYYRDQTAQAAIEVADTLDAVLAELDSEGVTAMYVSADDYRAYQARLSASGFNATEIAAARLVGLDDATIEKIRLRRIANNADLVSGDMRPRLTTLSASLREFGGALLHPVFSAQVEGALALPLEGSPALAAEGGSDLAAHSAGASLALIQPVINTFQVSNPTTQTAVVTLNVIPLDIPADWSVACDMPSLTLEPGQVATVTITTIPGSVALQGTQPRVAVEGYIAGQLIGGVVQDVVVPEQVAFSVPPYTVLLPLVGKK